MGVAEKVTSRFYLDIKDIYSLFLYNLGFDDYANNYFYYRPLWTYGSNSICDDLVGKYSTCEFQSLPIYSMHISGYYTGHF
jgi:hypothetical protein